jgi:epoxyqueuosine reductase
MNLAQEIKRKAVELGFDLVGITDASPIDARHRKLLSRWLRAGRAGRMSYLRRNLDKRTNPAALLENARSVICVALNYKPPKRKLTKTDLPLPMGHVADYARYEDYHPFIKKRLHRLAEFITSVSAPEHRFKICVDSAPLAERSLAQRAGLGFIGKNHMLINPALGPQIFLAEIITTLEISADEPLTDNCAECDRCIKACPTQALQPDGQFDANRCISYLTIEYDGAIPSELTKKIGARIFGCDECVLACPYQRNAPVRKNRQLKHYSDRVDLSLNRVLSLTQQEFDVEFADSPIKRPGLERLKRNAQICLDNTNPAV